MCLDFDCPRVTPQPCDRGGHRSKHSPQFATTSRHDVSLLPGTRSHIQCHIEMSRKLRGRRAGGRGPSDAVHTLLLLTFSGLIADCGCSVMGTAHYVGAAQDGDAMADATVGSIAEEFVREICHGVTMTTAEGLIESIPPPPPSSYLLISPLLSPPIPYHLFSVTAASLLCLPPIFISPLSSLLSFLLLLSPIISPLFHPVAFPLSSTLSASLSSSQLFAAVLPQAVRHEAPSSALHPLPLSYPLPSTVCR